MRAGADRLLLVQESLQNSSLDGLVVRLPENIVLTTGVWPANGVTVAVVPAVGEAALFLPDGELACASQGWVEDLRPYSWGRLQDPDPWESLIRLLGDWCRTRGLARGRLAFEGNTEVLSPPFWAAEPVASTQATRDRWERICPTASWVEASALLDRLRSRKTAEEIRRIRLSNAVAHLATTAFRTAIRPGVRESEVAAAVEYAVYANGPGHADLVQRTRAWAHVVSGERTLEGWRPFTVSTSRRLQLGDLILLELAVIADGYWSDLTRVHVLGAPTAQQRDAFSAVQAASAAARAALRAGAVASAVDAAARRVLEMAGLGKGFIHHTGHGTGLKYHESVPQLRPDSSDQLETGMVTTVEPGVYLAELGGLRIEENLLVADDGNTILSPEQGELAI